MGDGGLRYVKSSYYLADTHLPLLQHLKDALPGLIGERLEEIVTLCHFLTSLLTGLIDTYTLIYILRKAPSYVSDFF